MTDKIKQSVDHYKTINATIDIDETNKAKIIELLQTSGRQATVKMVRNVQYGL